MTSDADRCVDLLVVGALWPTADYSGAELCPPRRLVKAMRDVNPTQIDTKCFIS